MVRRLFRYEPETGHLYWQEPKRRALIGAVAGGLNDKGYIQVMLGGKLYRAHRLAWVYVHGKDIPPGMEIDHVNRNRSDNRLCNLRLASRFEQQANTKMREANTTGFRGVKWRARKSRWVASIRAYGKRIEIGSFLTKEEAGAAYIEARKKHLGEFAPQA